ncbi:LON peptidase substrate-binding domain-containing protein [Marinimicrococcus flavescens]|uniref:LON peptidase substrate-binding domain-containing protein n=1 Tax=Marinimicrococcus flavescens TaxID=3031815 RepID=A0AAP3UZM0_9PROT|nr:LON peptidase substrate-binding domain-containing protein [Marinimicrococcus flavescens]
MTGAAEALPSRFPIFPLRGALLLPGGNLPLNIFEPRYLAMIRDAMQTDRVIGMVQPRHDQESAAAPPEIYTIGCVGRISSFSETPDGRYLVTLSGACRFDVVEELESDTAYRQVLASFDRWRHDMQPVPPPDSLKDGLLGALEGYFHHHGIEAEWATLKTAPLAALVTSLSMICPFDPTEKQALLEARDLTRQAELLTALMQMDARSDTGDASPVRH